MRSTSLVNDAKLDAVTRRMADVPVLLVSQGKPEAVVGVDAAAVSLWLDHVAQPSAPAAGVFPHDQSLAASSVRQPRP